VARQKEISNLDIIKANQDHIDEMVQLFDAYRVFYEQPSSPDSARSFILERMNNDDSVIYLAKGDIDGELSALGFVQLYPTFSSVSMKPVWILNDLYVTEKGRQHGVGRALIDRARQLAVDTNAKGLILETAIDNAPAQALYDSYGFVRDTEFYRYGLEL